MTDSIKKLNNETVETIIVRKEPKDTLLFQKQSYENRIADLQRKLAEVNRKLNLLK